MTSVLPSMPARPSTARAAAPGDARERNADDGFERALDVASGPVPSTAPTASRRPAMASAEPNALEQAAVQAATDGHEPSPADGADQEPGPRHRGCGTKRSGIAGDTTATATATATPTPTPTPTATSTSTSTSTATSTSTSTRARSAPAPHVTAAASDASAAPAHPAAAPAPSARSATPRTPSHVATAAAPARVLRAVTEPRAGDRDLASATRLARREPSASAERHATATAAATPTPTAPPAAPPAAPVSAAAPSIERAAPATPLAPAFLPETASGAVLASAAHLHLSTDTLGDIALHLRLRDGTAHVRLESDAHAALEARAPELTRALAAEGIAVGRLEVEPRASTPAAATATTAHDAGSQPGGDGRRHREGPPSGEPAPTPAQPRARRPRRPGHDVTA